MSFIYLTRSKRNPHHTNTHTNLSFLLLSETKLSHSDKIVIGGTPAMATMEVLSSFIQSWTVYASEESHTSVALWQ